MARILDNFFLTKYQTLFEVLLVAADQVLMLANVQIKKGFALLSVQGCQHHSKYLHKPPKVIKFANSSKPL